MSKIWVITGANRGIGFEIAKAALKAGDKVVATARSLKSLNQAFGPENADLMFAIVDVTRPVQARQMVEAAKLRFGQIDVLVNNAGYGQLGIFEESAPEDVEAQFATNVFGVMHLCRAVLPVMRAQRSGHVFNLSSIAGLIGTAGGSLYCASKHAVEGFSEALSKEVSTFDIKVTLIEPGYFRTDFLDQSSVQVAKATIPDYGDISASYHSLIAARNHRQAGDPAKLGDIVVKLAHHDNPPLRFLAGSDAVQILEMKLGALKRDAEAWRAVSQSTDGGFSEG